LHLAMPLGPTSYGQISGNTPNRNPNGVGGRLPDTMKNRMKVLLERKKTLESIEKVLDDPDHRHFKGVLDTVLDRVEGKVPQGVDVTSGGKSVQGVVILPSQDGVAPVAQPALPAGNTEIASMGSGQPQGQLEATTQDSSE